MSHLGPLEHGEPENGDSAPDQEGTKARSRSGALEPASTTSTPAVGLSPRVLPLN